MWRSLKQILLPALIGFALLAVVGLVGSGLVVARAAFDFHPALGWATVSLIAGALVLLMVVPVVQLARLPRALVRPPHRHGAKWNRYLIRYADRLLGNERIREGYAGRETLAEARNAGNPEVLEGELQAALAHLDRQAARVVAEHAAAVFTSTAISQSGRLDTAIVVSAQVRMVRDVARIYYQRPHLRELTALYANVGTAAFLAGEIQDSELLAVLGAPVTAGITSFLPVGKSDPLVSLLINSLLEGSANAFLTLRVGVLARRSCGLRPERDRRLLARSASVEAAGLLGTVVSAGSARVASLTRKLVVKRATGHAKSAAKGVAGVGTSLRDLLLGRKPEPEMDEPIPEAVEQAESGFLPESLKFWEQIAARTGPDAER